MTSISSSHMAWAGLLALCAAAWAPAATAQRTRESPAAMAAAEAAAAAADAAMAAREAALGRIGTDTRSLLAIQREGSQAGATLHMPGEQAALAHARYLKSFQHPIPERFVGQSSGGGGGGVVGLTPPR